MKTIMILFVSFLMLTSSSRAFLHVATSSRRIFARRSTKLHTLKIYGNPGTRSPLVNWYLEELGVPYEDVDTHSIDRFSKDYPNPFGWVPAAEDGTLKLFESGAILLYIADKYGDLNTPEKRAEVAKWVLWANASLYPICFIENERGQVLDTKLRGRPHAITILDEILSERKWLIGDEFSAADVAVASYILYALNFFPQVRLATKWPHLAAYAADCASRHAYAKAFGEINAKKLAELAVHSMHGVTPRRGSDAKGDSNDLEF